MGNGQAVARFPHDQKAATMSVKAYKYRIYANKTTKETHMAVQEVQWGTIRLILDNEAFHEGFFAARRWYVEDVSGKDGGAPEEPQRADYMSSEELLRLGIMPGSDGIYHFDEMGMEHLPEYLGYLIGYMSGPLLPETSEKVHERSRSPRALQEV